MTEWEMIEPRETRGGAGLYGNAWTKYPCIAINTNGLTFNRLFVDLWIKGSSQVFIMRHPTNPRILAFKVVPRGEEVPGAFRFVRGGKAKSVSICNKPISNSLADCRGYCYRAHQNGTGLIIECDFSADKRCQQ